MGNKASSNKQKSKKGKHDNNNDEEIDDEFGLESKTNTDFISAPLPSSIEKILAQQNENEDDIKHIKAFGGSLSDQPFSVIDDIEIPSILLLLKKYLFQYNGYKCIGIFVNGSINDEDIDKSPEFISNGEVTLNDCNLVKKLIESNKITLNKFQIPNYNNNDKYYAMIFGELIKIWLFQLNEPLLQLMPSTFFDDITCIDYLELDIDKIAEPNLSSLIFLWDICVKIEQQKEINKMNANKLAMIFAPYLYKEKDKERNDQIQISLIKFFEVGIQWRMQNNI